MRGAAVFIVLMAGLGLSITLLAQSTLLPFARAVQRRRGYSDQFALEVTAMLSVGSFLTVALAVWAWLIA